MAAIREVLDTLRRLEKLHKVKNEDYSHDNEPYENFFRAAELNSWFSNAVDKTFANHIGTKLARLSVLLEPDRIPNNESVADTFDDLAMYCILWGSYHRSLKVR